MSFDAPVVIDSGSEDDFLGDTAAEQRADAALQTTLAGAVAIGFRQEHRHAQRAAARDDGDLVDRIVLGHRQADDGVTGLVIRGELLLLLVHDHGAALGAHHDLVLGALELVHRHRAAVGTSGEQRSFVDEVGEVGTGEARRTARDHLRLHVFSQRQLAHVDLEDLLATAHVRQRHHDLAVEAARTQQRRIQHVGTVGRGDDDHAFGAFETIHLDQQLVQGLLALVMTAAQAGATMTTDGVDFVDEDDARRVLLRLVEHVTHAGSRRRRRTFRRSQNRRW